MTTGSNLPMGRTYLWLLFSLIFAVAQFQLILVLYQAGVGASIQAAKGVVDGTPHWMVFQSRILGPYLIEFLALLCGSLGKAYFYFFLITQTLAGYLALRFSASLFTERFSAFVAFFAFQALFSLVVVPHRADVLALYAWDQVGIIVFFTFCYFALSEKGWPFLLSLFVIALFNRESAFFIALFLILKPLLDLYMRKVKSLDKAMLMTGVASFALGGVTIQYLRQKLLIRETMPDLMEKPDLAGQSLHVTLDSNFEYIRSAVMGAGSTVDFLIPLLITVVFYLAYMLARVSKGRYLAFSAVISAFMISTLFFGVVYEVRVYLEFIPFIVFSILYLSSQSSFIANR